MIWENLKGQAKKRGIETDSIYQIHRLLERIDQAEGKSPLHPPSAENK